MKVQATSMHSSRMRTGRALTVFLYWWRVSHFWENERPPSQKWETPPPPVSKKWDQTPRPLARHIPLPPRPDTHPPPVNRMTHTWENITFPASLRYAVGKNGKKITQSQTWFRIRKSPGNCRLSLESRAVSWVWSPQLLLRAYLHYRTRIQVGIRIETLNLIAILYCEEYVHITET